MASNYLTISGKSPLRLNVEATQKSQNIVNNTSVVACKASLSNTAYSWYYDWNDAAKIEILVDGAVVATLSPRNYDFRSGAREQCILLKDVTVNHSADGTKTVQVTARNTDDPARSSLGNVSVSVDLTLTTIPRGMVYVGNSSGVPKRGQVYIGNASGVPVQAKEVWVGNSSGVPKRAT